MGNCNLCSEEKKRNSNTIPRAIQNIDDGRYHSTSQKRGSIRHRAANPTAYSNRVMDEAQKKRLNPKKYCRGSRIIKQNSSEFDSLTSHGGANSSQDHSQMQFPRQLTTTLDLQNSIQRFKGMHTQGNEIFLNDNVILRNLLNRSSSKSGNTHQLHSHLLSKREKHKKNEKVNVVRMEERSESNEIYLIWSFSLLESNPVENIMHRQFLKTRSPLLVKHPVTSMYLYTNSAFPFESKLNLPAQHVGCAIDKFCQENQKWAIEAIDQSANSTNPATIHINQLFKIKHVATNTYLTQYKNEVICITDKFEIEDEDKEEEEEEEEEEDEGDDDDDFDSEDGDYEDEYEEEEELQEDLFINCNTNDNNNKCENDNSRIEQENISSSSLGNLKDLHSKNHFEETTNKPSQQTFESVCSIEATPVGCQRKPNRQSEGSEGDRYVSRVEMGNSLSNSMQARIIAGLVNDSSSSCGGGEGNQDDSMLSEERHLQLLKQDSLFRSNNASLGVNNSIGMKGNNGAGAAEKRKGSQSYNSKMKLDARNNNVGSSCLNPRNRNEGKKKTHNSIRLESYVGENNHNKSKRNSSKNNDYQKRMKLRKEQLIFIDRIRKGQIWYIGEIAQNPISSIA